MTPVVTAVGALAVAVLVHTARRSSSRRSVERSTRRIDWRGVWPGRLARWQARRRFADAVPVVLDDIARAVRSGSSLLGACREAVGASPEPVRVELAGVVARADRGLPLGTALGHWSRQHTSPDVRLAGAALALAASAGGSQARAVDGAAATLRERRAVVGEVRAQSAQARLSAVVIGLLPVAFLLWALLTDSRTAAFLVADPVGWTCLVAGIVLEGLGALWMRHILRGVTP